MNVFIVKYKCTIFLSISTNFDELLLFNSLYIDVLLKISTYSKDLMKKPVKHKKSYILIHMHLIK